MDATNNEKILPMLVLRGKVLFPNIYITFDVGRLKSLAAVAKAVEENGELFVVSQKNSVTDNPEPEDLFTTGVFCRVKKVKQLGETNIRVSVESVFRGAIKEYLSTDECFIVKIEELTAIDSAPIEEMAYLSVAKAKLTDYTKLNPKLSQELTDALIGIERPDEFVNVSAYNLPLSETEKQKILEEQVVTKRLELLSVAINGLLERNQIEKAIAERVKESVEKSQKEYYLREQLKAIHTELGDDEDEINGLREKIIEKKMPQEIEEKALKELERMSRMNSSSPDYTVLRAYLDWIIDLPFNEKTVDREDLKEAVQILDGDHFGLEKVKKRIVEYLAVLKLTGKTSSSILCLAGPPGVGKTSVATSVARALGRKFVRMSLGGVKDEAEIRGHRKTYIGAMPGRIIYGLKSAEVSNPVFLLDEIDKLSSDLRGDPASALLEVLDPEQNKTFRDRYLEIPYDLSNVLFITTANNLQTIPEPLLDRMEIIELDGYTQEEKVEISKRYLIPKRLKTNGLDEGKIEFDEEALKFIVKGYTLEAGVRNLERQIDSILRKIATEYAEKGTLRKRKITSKKVVEYLGAPRHLADEALENDEIGAATGLAWTAYGGTTLTIEVGVMHDGKGEIMLTGKLGDVMKESARAALSYLRAHAVEYNIPDDKFTKNDIHIHVPEGATPKDGPSAGVTMATALFSAITDKAVRKDVAMTGEITLRGKVLPIGGLKEKSLAAFRAGIYKLIIPEANRKDLEDIPDNIRAKLDFTLVKNIDEVFKAAIKEKTNEKI